MMADREIVTVEVDEESTASRQSGSASGNPMSQKREVGLGVGHNGRMTPCFGGPRAEVGP